MKTYHIHISGLVQGVGFRPHVFQLAEKAGLNGWVSNTKDGVHIEINAGEKTARQFYQSVLQQKPANAVITAASLREVGAKTFDSFSITTEDNDRQTDLLLTPDFAICDSCKTEIADPENRRYRYPFTTCLQCGPRYSILRTLPYERAHTSMAHLPLCSACAGEYANVHDRRHFSQTNSCPECSIPIHLYTGKGIAVSHEAAEILKVCHQKLEQGFIIAVKGIGGYLLLCDATNIKAIQQLRKKKQRPAKPFALLYSGTAAASGDVELREAEITALKSKAGPIVLCRIKDKTRNNICISHIAPGLDKVGLMLPAAPLLQLLSADFGRPLVATSANTSGSPIIYKDEDALEKLSGIADYILTYEREILMPQDDSVLQLTARGEQVLLRRSRGLAPNYFPNPFEWTHECMLAMGGELKSVFAIQQQQQLYVSQYLGNQENLASQQGFAQTLAHLFGLLQTKPACILADKHPGYFVSGEGYEIAHQENIPLHTIQHHEAHFGAVLAENGLLHSQVPVLGVIWDGAGYGNDGQVWGGEFFIYKDYEMLRAAQLEYFPQLLGDKMSREPRLSAFSLLHSVPAAEALLKKRFTENEWKYYRQLIKQPAGLVTSSAGRLLDAVASLLDICQVNSYEGEAAMRLEAVARTYIPVTPEYYTVAFRNNRLDLSLLLQELVADTKAGFPANRVAYKFFYSLAISIGKVSDRWETGKIALSGGVFQNALLNDMVDELYQGRKEIFRHLQLSPNDECLGFGQLACYHIMQLRKKEMSLPATAMMQAAN